MSARPVKLKAPLVGLVCAKCVKRAGGNGKKAGKQLTRALRAATGSKIQAREIGCLKLCPKHHVLVVPINGAPHLVPNDDWLNQATALLSPPNHDGD